MDLKFGVYRNPSISESFVEYLITVCCTLNCDLHSIVLVDSLQMTPTTLKS